MVATYRCTKHTQPEGDNEEKLKNYAQLAEEVRHVWRQRKVRVVPPNRSTTGVVPTTLLESLEKLNRPVTLVNKIQTGVLIRTTSIVGRHKIGSVLPVRPIPLLLPPFKK